MPSSLHRTALNLILASAVFLSGCSGGGGGGGGVPDPAPSVAIKVEPVLGGLKFPGSFTFAPDGRLFFTEVYTGKVQVVSGGTIQTAPFVTLDGPAGDEIVLGVTLDPDFSSNHFVYVFNTTANPTRSRVIRYRERDGRGTDPLVLIDNLPQGFHDGGQLQFGEDGDLFISIGDTANPDASQDPAQLSGKILRIDSGGGIPGGNPIDDSPVFALGFRNVFGMAVHPESGRLFVSDNGPECNDEVDLIENGGNYGWREGQPCDDTDTAFIQPIIAINPTIGITGIMFYQGELFPEFENNLFVGDVNSGAIRRYTVDGETGAVGEGVIMLDGGYGGIIAVANGPDGAIYFSTADAIYKVVRG